MLQQVTHAATTLHIRQCMLHCAHAFEKNTEKRFFFFAPGLQNEGVARAESAADAEIMTMTTTAGEMVLQL